MVSIFKYYFSGLFSDTTFQNASWATGLTGQSAASHVVPVPDSGTESSSPVPLKYVKAWTHLRRSDATKWIVVSWIWNGLCMISCQILAEVMCRHALVHFKLGLLRSFGLIFFGLNFFLVSSNNIRIKAWLLEILVLFAKLSIKI